MVASDGAEIAQSLDRLGGAGLVAQPFRRQGDAVLVAGGVEFGAVGDGVVDRLSSAPTASPPGRQR